jgi:uncharacterized membrane protein (DUF373 family)
VSGPWLDRTDNALYVLIAVLFLLSAAGMAVYAVVHLLRNLDRDFPVQLVGFINDLLLVLIILEVFSTVRSYLETHTTSVKPFLYIGIISATRRILAIGAQMTLSDRTAQVTGGQIEATLSNSEFRNRMIDLGVNGAVVLALAIALYLLRREPDEAPSRQPVPDHEERM